MESSGEDRIHPRDFCDLDFFLFITGNLSCLKNLGCRVCCGGEPGYCTDSSKKRLQPGEDPPQINLIFINLNKGKEETILVTKR